MTNDIIKDPVCGMTVRAGESVTASYQGRTFHFCSDLCQRKFLVDPEKYARVTAAVVAGQADTARHIAYFSINTVRHKCCVRWAAVPHSPVISTKRGIQEAEGKKHRVFSSRVAKIVEN